MVALQAIFVRPQTHTGAIDVARAGVCVVYITLMVVVAV